MANNKTNLFETDVLEYLFNNTAISLTNAWYVCLFSAYSDQETQTFTEINYAGGTPYARIQKTRTDNTHWTVSGNQVSNATAITFAQNLAASQTASHAGLALDGTEGAADIAYAGALTSSLVISTNVTPEFAIGAFVLTEE